MTAGKVAERRDMIARLSREGMRVSDIARDVGVAKSTVGNVRRALGLATRKPVAFTEDEIRRIERLLDEGASYAEVGRTVGRLRQVVAGRVPGRGWSMRQRDEHTRVLRHYGLMGASGDVQEQMWREKKASARIRAMGDLA